MMAKSSTQESARQVLGNALRFYREQRRMSQRDLANRVGVSIGDIDDWERGKHAPPENRWGRLCKMLHDDLAGMRATWQRACAEEARERETSKVTTGALTSRPFAALGAMVVEAPQPPPPPAPVLSIVPRLPAEPVPETLHDDGFDLRPAYRAVAKLPDGWRTAEAIEERQRYARDLIARGLTNEDIYKQVRVKFGVGIGQESLMRLRAEVRESKTRTHQASTVPTTPPAPPAPSPAPTPADPPRISANDVEGAVRLILEAIPNLKTFKIDVDEGGEVHVEHTVREVRVIETRGSLKLKK